MWGVVVDLVVFFCLGMSVNGSIRLGVVVFEVCVCI